MAHEELSPLNITPGAIRFNTDSMKLEYFRIGMEGGSTSSYAGIGTLAAGEWVQITTDTPEVQTGGTRAVMAGRYSGGTHNEIDYVNIDTTGNAIDFGDLLETSYLVSGAASRTRGLFFPGLTNPGTPSYYNRINFITIASTGNAADFGDTLSTAGRNSNSACGDSTRALYSRGILSNATTVNTIEYVTIGELGNTVDFGDLSVARQASAALSSSTRGVWGGGSTPSEGSGSVVIDFVTISTLGNAADFGDLIDGIRREFCAASNSTRGLFMGGSGPGDNDTVQYITIATQGNAIDFGDLSNAFELGAPGASPTRIIHAGGTSPGSNVIDFFNISTLGNAQDFGDRTVAGYGAGGCSNGHGGLG